MYWPAFEFNYRLDVRRLVPHITAIESCREAASIRVLPPQWREPSGLEDDSPQGKDLQNQAGLSSGQKPPVNEAALARRKLRVSNLLKARAWTTQRFIPGGEPLSLNDILNLHRLASDDFNPENTPGSLRTTEVQVGRREVGGIHVGAPPERLPVLMEGYVQFLNSKELLALPPVIHALVAHFFFVTIHPFADGNGRVSRLLAAGLLFQHGYNMHSFYGLSNYFYQHDIQYHTLLHRCWQTSPFELTPFVMFGMEGMVIELKGISNFIRMKLARAI